MQSMFAEYNSLVKMDVPRIYECVYSSLSKMQLIPWVVELHLPL